MLFLGANEELGKVVHLEVLSGNLFRKSQVKNAEKVAVIGEELAQTLFHRTNVVGKRIRFEVGSGEESYQVIGVVRSQTGFLNGTLGAVVPAIVYLPYSCLADENMQADQIFVQCVASADADAVATEAVSYLQDRRQVGGKLSVQNISGAVHTLNRVVDSAALVFTMIASIAFFLAMLGVCSSLLAAADERREQIGLFLAIGAKPQDIRKIFLYQSILLCFIGGVSGSAVGAILLKMAIREIPALASMRIGWSWAAFSAAAIVGGAVCGIIPATRASHLNPVDTM